MVYAKNNSRPKSDGNVNDTLCLLHHAVQNSCQRTMPLGAILNLTSSIILSQDLACYL